MHNPYSPPSINLQTEMAPTFDNNSGGGKTAIPPPGVKGWSWGAFVFGWVWGALNNTWIAMLCLIPSFGVLFKFYIGAKGRELAWQNKRWESLEHFNRAQRKWSIAAGVLFGFILTGVITGFMIGFLEH